MNQRTTTPRILLTALVALLVTPVLAQDTSKFTAPGGLSGLLGQKKSSHHLTVKGRFILDESKAKGYLQIRADLADKWHIYSMTQPQGVGAPQKTKIIVQDSPDFQVIGSFTADKAPSIKNLQYVSVPIEEFSGHVVWSAPIELSNGVDPAQLTIQGEIDGQICEEDGVCMPLSSLDSTFVANYDASLVAPSTDSSTTASGTSGGPSAIDSRMLSEIVKFMLYGFAGGMILNLMPCVLPVIGLKIMSFSSQAGQSRARVILLNLYYVAGIVAVFIVLAAMAAFFGWGWGEQFQKPEFGIALAAIVFVFGLSFLGVWEIPIPGFVGSSGAMQKAEGEGGVAAFLKGILTTLLATPCGGPLIAPTLAWAIVQPKPVIFATFISMGLGMGAPYLAISMFPKLMNFVPKPGAWMDTFKQVMGFVMLGTVVWIFSFLPDEKLPSTLALLFVLWAACWWINRTPLTASFGAKAKSYLIATVFAVVVGTTAFWLFLPGLHWDDYTDRRLASLQEAGKTVLVDFTADY